MQLRITVHQRPSVRNGIAYLALGFFILLAVFPIYWMAITAFKQDYDLINPKANPFWFHTWPVLSHFSYLFTHTNFTHWLLNTTIIGACTVAITLAIGIPAGYALAPAVDSHPIRPGAHRLRGHRGNPRGV